MEGLYEDCGSFPEGTDYERTALASPGRAAASAIDQAACRPQMFIRSEIPRARTKTIGSIRSPWAGAIIFMYEMRLGS